MAKKLSASTVELINDLKRQNPTWTGKQISEHLASKGIKAAPRTVRENLAKDRTTESVAQTESVEWKEEDKDGTATISAKTKARTLEEFIELYKIDLDVWEIERHIINQWEVGANTDDGIKTTPLFQIKVWLKKKVSEIDPLEAFNSLKGIFATLPAPKLKKYTYEHKGGLLEINIFDPHIGKMCWFAETDNNYDIKIAEELFLGVIKDFLNKASGLKIDRILFPVGNDLFHVDTKLNTTTAGTFQDVDGRHQKVFTSGCNLLIKAIELLRQVAPVDVPVIAGNHDELSTQHAGLVLDAYFRSDKNVVINNSPKLRKYYKYYNSLIGMTHGNNEKLADLPIIMAQEAKEEWCSTEYRFWRLAHFHHRKKGTTESTADYKGIQITTGKSISGTDAWHKSKGYIGSIRGAEAYFHEKENGVVVEFSHNIK